MLRAIIAGQIGKLERRWGYDASYLKAVLKVSPASALKFALGAQAADPKAAPPEAIAAAKLAATLAEDCGPCTQIVVDMALAEKVDPAILRAVLIGDEAAMGQGAALAWRFARASLARDLESADAARDEVVARWGEAGLVALSLSIVTARMYPTLKYALGYGRACSKVTVAGADAPVAHVSLAA